MSMFNIPVIDYSNRDLPSPSTGGEPTPSDDELGVLVGGLTRDDTEHGVTYYTEKDVYDHMRSAIQLDRVRHRVAGGEPATDSAGRIRKALEAALILCDTDAQRVYFHGEIEALAAREPAPVARELDVEAERRKRVTAIVPPEIVKQVISHYKLGVKHGAPNVLGDARIFRADFSCAYEIGLKDDAARQSTAESAPASAAPDEQWISVEDQLPEQECLAAYETPNGKVRMIRAKYARQFQIEAEGDDCETEYNDDDDTFYIKAGWLECIDNWGEYSSCYVVEGVVTHWMPLPAAPSNSSPVGAKESK